jgi:hypothetical protein
VESDVLADVVKANPPFRDKSPDESHAGTEALCGLLGREQVGRSRITQCGFTSFAVTVM